MPYPLGGSTHSDPVFFPLDEGLPELIQVFPMTQFTNFSKQNNMVYTNRERDVIFPLDEFLPFEVHQILGEFRWNGIGGSIYIPSFPQLERQATTFPHAF